MAIAVVVVVVVCGCLCVCVCVFASVCALQAQRGAAREPADLYGSQEASVRVCRELLKLKDERDVLKHAVHAHIYTP